MRHKFEAFEKFREYKAEIEKAFRRPYQATSV